MVHLPDPRAPFQHHLALLALKNAGEEKKKRRKKKNFLFQFKIQPNSCKRRLFQ